MDDSFPDAAGIYEIRNTTDGRVYIGSAVSLRSRLHHHRHHLRRGNHRSSRLQRAWDKHGAAAFCFSVVERVADRSELISREQYWIDQRRSADRRYGYNICPNARNSLGVVRSEAVKAKISASLKGREGRPVTEETRRKLSEAHQRRRPESYANLIRAGLKASKGRIVSSEERERRSASTKGRLHVGIPKSDEHRKKLAEANRGKSPSAETRAKMSAAHKGRPVSEKAREALRLANIARWSAYRAAKAKEE